MKLDKLVDRLKKAKGKLSSLALGASLPDPADWKESLFYFGLLNNRALIKQALGIPLDRQTVKKIQSLYFSAYAKSTRGRSRPELAYTAPLLIKANRHLTESQKDAFLLLLNQKKSKWAPVKADEAPLKLATSLIKKSLTITREDPKISKFFEKLRVSQEIRSGVGENIFPTA